LSDKAQNILVEETKFLKSIHSMDGSAESAAKTEKFNKKMDSLLLDIDKYIFSLLDICEEEIDQIYEDLSEMNLHIYGYCAQG